MTIKLNLNNNKFKILLAQMPAVSLLQHEVIGLFIHIKNKNKPIGQQIKMLSQSTFLELLFAS